MWSVAIRVILGVALWYACCSINKALVPMDWRMLVMTAYTGIIIAYVAISAARAEKRAALKRLTAGLLQDHPDSPLSAGGASDRRSLT